VCLPEKNKGSFAELPLTIRRRIDVKFVSHLEDVLQECLEIGNFMRDDAADMRQERGSVSSDENMSA
jgi:ATP-dependent Lon protease